MILVDANLLIYAFNSSAREHDKARAWLEEALSSPTLVGLSWSTVSAFLRITTSRAVFPEPLGSSEAVAIVDSWLARPMVVLVEPGPRYWELVKQLLVDSNSRGPLVADAMLAALAIENGATLATHDVDFRRFDGLKLFDPLAG
jgi:toxin-antitoxin system PIN domain toxin